MQEKFNGKSILINEEKAFRVFDLLNQEWQAKQGFFKNVILPQDKYPNQQNWNSCFKNDKERANWLFYASLPMRGGLMSEDPFKLLWMLKQNLPELFDPKEVYQKWWSKKIAKTFRYFLFELFAHKQRIKSEKIQKSNPNLSLFDKVFIPLQKKKEPTLMTLDKFLNRLPGYKIDEHARNWHWNSIVLYRYWDSDIRNVFKGAANFEEAFARIDYRKQTAGFKGMRRKIFALLTIWLQEKNLIPIFPTPIPIDFHALRILWALEIIRWTSWDHSFIPKAQHPQQLTGKPAIRVNESLINLVTWWSQKFIYQESCLSHLKINPALWTLSRSLCSEAFQNTSQKGGKQYFETKELLNNPYLWPKKYKDPCSYCPFEKDCQWAIPSAPYYKWGLLIKIGKRVDYPVKKLPWQGWEYKSLRNNRS